MQSILIDVNEEGTVITYVDGGNVLFDYTSPIGLEVIRKRGFSISVANDWLSYILWCMHAISYVDRIPDLINLKVSESSMWFKTILESYSYAQFYIKTKSSTLKPHVIIQDKDISYARHQKTFSEFKI
jgi:hypothetical protein